MGKGKSSVSPSCGDIWIDGDFLLGALSIAALGAVFLINQAITMAGKRRKRRRKRRDGDLALRQSSMLKDLLFRGKNGFQSKSLAFSLSVL